MGQMTYGILLGIPAPADNEELFEAWEAENKAEIEKLALESNYWTARDTIVPDFEGENDLGAFIGFWVAVGASGKDGVRTLSASLLEGIEETYQQEIDLAKKRWLAFADYAASRAKTKAEKSKFYGPKLYLLETEVA